MSALPKDPYEILGITRDATEGEAKRNFRLLAKQYHPDRNPGDKAAETHFKKVHTAWEALRD
ncbi:MAG TPA: DnaJ domain-containing protein, partial [Gemmataceae bacterium]|nr:DnaJ domain-containing protein [Gemmataceae bacterium]